MPLKAQPDSLSNSRTRTFLPQGDTTSIDTVGIVPNSLKLFLRGERYPDSLFHAIPFTPRVVFVHGVPTDSMTATYRVTSFDFTQPHRRYSTDLIRPESEYLENPYTYSPVVASEPFFGSTDLSRSGSISRGVGFGNNRNLSVNSTLSLQLSGKLTDNINVLASVSDDNIPIQPEGNTAVLQEFDQVYIRLFDDQSQLTAGDFEIEGAVGYFTRYRKRAQGASFTTERPLREGSDVKFFTQTSAALSRGKFARNEIRGVEGNQGPYRLRGNENEAFIIVIAGTERIFIDGRQLERGQDRDYVIDYNTAEITFTTRRPITKDKRITAEFQYSDANYARSLVQTSTGLKSDRFSAYVNFYTEQDAKNQSLQQDLGDAEKAILAGAGNDPSGAVAPGYEPVEEFTNDVILYTVRDSLGYDTVFVRAGPDTPPYYRVVFSDVGAGNGDYVQAGFDAGGRVFRWVAPDTSNGQVIRSGNYAPIRRLVAPKKTQMVMVGGTYKFSDRTEAKIEGGFTHMDPNTFSDIGNEDNLSPAVSARISHEMPLSEEVDAAKITGSAELEWIGENFNPLEPYRAVEFTRDWNLPLEISRREQRISRAAVGFRKTNLVKADYTISEFYAGRLYSGLKNDLVASAELTGFSADLSASLLHTRGQNPSEFFRHRSRIEKTLFFSKIGFRDDRESNRRFAAGGDSLLPSAYRFYDWEVYLAESDSTQIQYRVFYGEREDFAVSSNRFATSTHAQNYGAELTLASNPNNRLSATATRRILRIKDEELSDAAPEKTVLLRLDHNMRLWKNAVTTSTNYAIGSGLERKQEFVYLQDPTGQGPFTWIDYNENGIRELNEFETARPEDGDRYIRVYTPTDDYERVYSNKYSQTLNLNPLQSWANSEGILNVLSRFNSQTAFRIERKTRREDDADRYNPFADQLSDSVLVSRSSSIRSTLFFNRSNPNFAADYGYAVQKSKLPMTAGFESRNSVSHLLRARLTLIKSVGLSVENEIGERESDSDLLSGRTYLIEYYRLKQTLSYQPGTDFRLSLSNEYTDKVNVAPTGGETARLVDLGLELRYNKVETGIFSAQFNAIHIEFDGSANNSLAYEMLDGLQNGRNFTWAAGVQRSIGKNLQLNLTYHGRKSEEIKAVHTGNVQMRAYF